MKILNIVTDGFEEVEYCGTLGILRRGNILIDSFLLHGTEVIGRYGIVISNLKNYKKANLDEYDVLFIAGGPEYTELENSKDFLNIIKYFYENNKLICAICAGPTILGHLGYLKNKNYTCFSSMNEDFKGTFIDTYCVKDGNIITGKSAAATIDFAFLIMETLLGKA